MLRELRPVQGVSWILRNEENKTVISEMLGANSKTAGWVEVLVM